eukprot:2247982-Rhodomonas_salina.1
MATEHEPHHPLYRTIGSYLDQAFICIYIAETIAKLVAYGVQKVPEVPDPAVPAPAMGLQAAVPVHKFDAMSGTDMGDVASKNVKEDSGGGGENSAHDAMCLCGVSGTVSDIAHGAICLRDYYAMPGTDIAYGLIRRRRRGRSGGLSRTIFLRSCYAMSGTGLA